MLQISVLGPLEVRRDGEIVAVPAGKTSELLVRLALEPGVVVRTDRLVDDLWAAGAATTRRNTLQSKIAKLRRALGDPAVIVNRDGGYELAVEPSAIDAFAVVNQAADASLLLDAGDNRGAADTSARALQLYRGDVLQGAGDGEWVEPHRARLVEARVKLVESGLSARLQLGETGAAIGELEAAVAEYPFQEGLWELLITALYRAGRQADALAAYQRVRAVLADELGLDPGPQLQELEQQVLMQDPDLEAGDRAARLLDPNVGGNLPSMAAELVGRSAEIATVCELLERNRLVEIVGPGGIGKTALAVAIGKELRGTETARGGVWLVRLETATTDNAVVDAAVAALNVSGETALSERLRSTTALLILDNCEHVVDAAAALAVHLLDAAPGLRILCTSQVALEVDGEALFELTPLELADAVELFARRSGARRSDGESEVHELCRALDGLPLAIELAAARTKTLSVAEITRRLDDRFNVLHDPTSRKSERRRALRATIGWSYELLFPDDKRGLWALATFAGGASLPAVESVLEQLGVPASAAIDVVGRLASRSLVIVDDEGPATPVRYRLLDSIRAFALEAMAEAGATEGALEAHASWFADAARTSRAGVRGRDQAEHLAFARVERANIDAALAWSAGHEPMVALELAIGFGWAWVVLGDSRGAQRILAALDAAGVAAPAPARADALLLAAWIEASTDRLELAREHIAAATALADTTADVDLQARASYYLAYVVSHDGRFREALELTDRSNALYAERDRHWDQAANWLFAARAAISAGDVERSVEARDQIGRWLQSVEDPWLHVRYEAILGELARVEHRFDDAVLHLARAAETSARLGFQQTEAYQVSSLGRAQCQAGDYETGAATLELAVEKAERIGDVRMAALARIHLGRVLRALGQTDRARAALEAANAWHRANAGGEQAALGECLIAAMDAADGVPEAAERLDAILADARRNDAAHVEVFALDALARISVAAGGTASARALESESDRRMRAASHFISERDRTDAPSRAG